MANPHHDSPRGPGPFCEPLRASGSSFSAIGFIGACWIIIVILFHAFLEGPLTNIIEGYTKYLSEFFVFGIGAAYAAYYMSRKIPLKKIWHPFYTPLIAFFLYMVVQAIVLKVHPVVMIYMVRAFARPIMLAALTGLIAVENGRYLNRIRKTLIWTGVILAVLTILQYFLPELPFWSYLRPSEVISDQLFFVDTFLDRPYPSVTFAFYAYLASFLLPIAVWLQAVSIYSPKKDQWLSFAAKLVAIGCFFTCDRKSQIVLILAVVFLIGMKRGVQRCLLPGLVIMILIVSLMFGKSLTSGYSWIEGGAFDRYFSLFSPEYWAEIQAAGEKERYYTAIYGISGTLRNHPLLGSGYGTIGNTMTDSSIVPNPDAMYREYGRLSWIEAGDLFSLRFITDVGWVCLFAQGGLIGTALFIWFLWAALRMSQKMSKYPPTKHLGFASICLLGAFAMQNIAKPAFLDKTICIPTGIIMGIIFAEAWGKGFRGEQARNCRTAVVPQAWNGLTAGKASAPPVCGSARSPMR